MNQTPITIDARFVRSAQLAQAKKDVRYYLNGFLLDTTGMIVATNGHYLYAGKYTSEPGVAADVIIRIDGVIPKSAGTVEFTFNENMKEGVCKTNTRKLFAFDVIDGEFPDWEKVKPVYTDEFTDGLVVNPVYLALLAKIFPEKAGLIIQHGTDREVIQISQESQSEYAENSFFLLMPVKSDKAWQNSKQVAREPGHKGKPE